jgi:hypothetical protein
MNRKRLAVALETSVHLYDIENMKSLAVIPTAPNPKGVHGSGAARAHAHTHARTHTGVHRDRGRTCTHTHTHTHVHTRA